MAQKKRYKNWIVFFLCFCLAIQCSGCALPEEAENALRREVGDILIGTPKEVTSISVGRYAYEQLDEDTRVVYDQILDCILLQEESVPVSTWDPEVVGAAYDGVLMDYGGLFWIAGYQYSTYSTFGETVGVEFAPTYVYTKEERESLQQQVDAVVEEWMSGISINDSDYDKAKYVFETLIEKVDYDLESRDNQNILSVFLYGETVCQGYADATQYLLQNLGVQTAVVTGTADGTNHAWNLVCLDGNYYYTDTTWGNSKYRSAAEEELKNVNYAYLNADSWDLAESHISNNHVPLPDSTSTEDTYFVREGLYFDSFSADDIGNRIQSAREQGQSRISIRLGDAETYKKTLDYFILDSRVFDYCPGLPEISYLENTRMKILTFIFE